MNVSRSFEARVMRYRLPRPMSSIRKRRCVSSAPETRQSISRGSLASSRAMCYHFHLREMRLSRCIDAMIDRSASRCFEFRLFPASPPRPSKNSFRSCSSVRVRPFSFAFIFMFLLKSYRALIFASAFSCQLSLILIQSHLWQLQTLATFLK